ncbi:MAG: ATP-binding cassette domain-containing protein [Zetaproteobacteria bacterium]|nr:ATP-binding cassette domain-containing protein [Zetaproteobacteria bacterium]
MKHHIDINARFGSLKLDVQVAFNHELIVISGENGAGKTSLLRSLAGLKKVDGSIQINQQLWLDSAASFLLPTEQRKLGFVWAGANLLPWLNVKQNLTLGGRKYEYFESILEDLALISLLERQPSMLSTGEAQRVALARAMYAKPSLLLLDEPFSAQAPDMRHRLREVLKTWQEKHQIPVLLVSHDVEDAKVLAQQHWYMREGKLLKTITQKYMDKVKTND